MRKIRASVLIGILIIIPAIHVAAQNLRVENPTSDKIRISAPDADNICVIMNPRSSGDIDILPYVNDGSVRFRLKIYVGFDLQDKGVVTRVVKNGKFSVAEPKQNQSETKQNKTSSAGGNQQNYSPPKSDKTIGNSGRNIVWSNKFSHKLTCYVGPFQGITLRPKKTSKETRRANSGLEMHVFGYEQAKDSLATGRKYNWVACNLALAEDEDTLFTYSGNLTQANTGNKIKKLFINELPQKFYFPGDENSLSYKDTKVSSIGAHSRKYVDFFEGWNVIPAQYKDKDGLPVQVILLFLITKEGRTVKITNKDLRPSINPEQIMGD